LASNTVTQRLAALRFFYVQVLKRGWSVAETPYPKKVLHLPQVLSPEEVARLIDAAEFSFSCSGTYRLSASHLAQNALPSSLQPLPAASKPTISRCNCRAQPPIPTLQLIRTCSTIYKTHKLPRGAASFKSLYLKRPSRALRFDHLS